MDAMSVLFSGGCFFWPGEGVRPVLTMLVMITTTSTTTTTTTTTTAIIV